MKTIKKEYINEHNQKIIEEYNSQNQLIKKTTYVEYDGCRKLISIQIFYPKTKNVFSVYEKEIIYRYDGKVELINEYNKNDIRLKHISYDEDGNIDYIAKYPYIDNDYMDGDTPISYNGKVMDDKFLEEKHDDY